MVMAPAKARSDIEILVELFNQWVDERITDSKIPPLSDDHKFFLLTRIGTLEVAKQNLERLAKEVVNGS